MLFSQFSIQGKNREMYHFYWHSRFVSQVDNETLYRRWLVYNNLLWMWIILFCQKAFSLQNCSVHTWGAGRELPFHYNIPHNPENIEPLKSVPVTRSSSLRSWLSRVSNRLSISYWHTKYLLLHVLALSYLEEFFFLMSLFFPLLWAKHRTCIGLLLLPILYAASAVLYGPLNKECVV